MTADILAKMKMTFQMLDAEQTMEEMSLAQLLYHAVVVTSAGDNNRMAVGKEYEIRYLA